MSHLVSAATVSTAFCFPDVVDGCECGICSRVGVVGADKMAELVPPPVFEEYRLMKVMPDGTQRLPTEAELKEFEQQVSAAPSCSCL
jgi:hypothetical protein